MMDNAILIENTSGQAFKRQSVDNRDKKREKERETDCDPWARRSREFTYVNIHGFGHHYSGVLKTLAVTSKYFKLNASVILLMKYIYLFSTIDKLHGSNQYKNGKLYR